jgi:hypothetical protein
MKMFCQLLSEKASAAILLFLSFICAAVESLEAYREAIFENCAAGRHEAVERGRRCLRKCGRTITVNPTQNASIQVAWRLHNDLQTLNIYLNIIILSPITGSENGYYYYYCYYYYYYYYYYYHHHYLIRKLRHTCQCKKKIRQQVYRSKQGPLLGNDREAIHKTKPSAMQQILNKQQFNKQQRNNAFCAVRVDAF